MVVRSRSTWPRSVEATEDGTDYLSLTTDSLSLIARAEMDNEKTTESSMAFEDKNITCEDCGCEFVHSADDQARYAERGFETDPKRCRPCREKRKAARSGGGSRGGGGDRADRPSFEAVCSACGVNTTVPFKPSGDRPVYCRDCYRQRRD